MEKSQDQDNGDKEPIILLKELSKVTEELFNSVSQAVNDKLSFS